MCLRIARLSCNSIRVVSSPGSPLWKLLCAQPSALTGPSRQAVEEVGDQLCLQEPLLNERGAGCLGKDRADQPMLSCMVGMLRRDSISEFRKNKGSSRTLRQGF